MTVEQRNEASITTKPAFQAVGIKWEGTYAEAGAGGIRAIHEQLQERLAEIPYAIHKDTMLGLSYHAHPGAEGFTHYATVEVEKVGDIPEGMVAIAVPELTYATCHHAKQQNIQQSYTNVYNWIREQGYQEKAPDGLTHLEQYPMEQDPYDDQPEFVIMIPVE
ncbi:GyrI-like domain-containing protein [Paenibacillus sp. 7541]|uniref:GyrI-like domain-containing protein n=1 Tax=Paenibacillus sp. 7541 TaxID=2026236 RepID=UPI000BA4F55E|nr:GyrI-like domain-containing protein [Paenibacillus sp. 7541]PAK49433.1 AraC family transcriptional regulator [Paenibacillus sp. 7541]